MKRKDIEGLTSACQRVQYCCQTLTVGKQKEGEVQRNNLYFFPITDPIANSLQTPRGVGYIPHAVVREPLKSSSVQLHPSLPWSSSTWYSPFKRLHVISVCAGSSLRAAAHSTLSSAGAFTFPYAFWAASLFLLCLFALSPLALLPLFLSFFPLPFPFSPHTYSFSDCAWTHRRLFLTQ